VHTLHVTLSSLSLSRSLQTLDQSYIEQAVVTGYRNIYGYPLLPACDRKTRRAVEYILRTAFQRRAKELGGKYYPLISLTQQEAEGLENDAMCLLPPDAPEATPLNPSIETFFDYPDGRGVYQNREKQVRRRFDRLRCVHAFPPLTPPSLSHASPSPALLTVPCPRCSRGSTTRSTWCAWRAPWATSLRAWARAATLARR
jgi:hypothetical protein